MLFSRVEKGLGSEMKGSWRVVTMKESRRAAFTLVELLAVIAVIAVVAGIVLGISGIAARKASEARAKAQFERIRMGIENYRIEYGRYPHTDSLEELIDLLHDNPSNDNKRVFLEVDGKEIQNGVIIDPWGNEYEYTGANPTHNPGLYDLASRGPDGNLNTIDDISNW